MEGILCVHIFSRKMSQSQTFNRQLHLILRYSTLTARVRLENLLPVLNCFKKAKTGKIQPNHTEAL